MNLRKEANYLEEYDIVDDREKRALAYRGDLFQYRGSETDFLRFKRRMLASSVLVFLFWILLTVLDPASLRGSGNPVVMLSYVLLLFFAACSLHAAVHLYRLPICLERRAYDRYVVRYGVYTAFSAVCSAAALLGQIYSMAVCSPVRPNEAAAALCLLLLLLLSGLGCRLHSRQTFENIGREV